MNPLNPQAPSIPLPKPGSKAYEELANSGLMGELQSEVSVEATPLLSFFINHAKHIVSLVVILLIAIIGYGSYQWYQGKIFKDAELALGKIIVQPDPVVRLTELQNYVKTAPANLQAGVQLSIAALAIEQNNLDLAGQTYGQIHTANLNAAIGYIAALNQVDVLRRQNKYPEALVILNILISSVPVTLLPTIQESTAACAEQMGDLKQALAMYEAILAARPAQNGQDSYYQAKVAELKAKIQS